MSAPFVLSIEITEGESFKHGYHLGTILSIAKVIAEERFNARVQNRQPVVTVALLQNNHIVDVFYGDKWHSEMGA